MLLEEYRQRTGESIRAMARRLGIDESSLRKKMRGGGSTVDEAIRIIDGCGGLVKLEDLKRQSPRKQQDRRRKAK